MTVEFTEWATEILNRAQQAAVRFNPGVKIRLARTESGVEAILAEEPEATDQAVTCGEMTLFVEQGLEGLVDCKEPHDQLVLRPAGSFPNPKGEH
ncbi:MAG: hypothetical protein MUP92_00910 [Actinobacteria bacterium]|nr:hypothetical protein [Actinomycetota bacterium]